MDTAAVTIGWAFCSTLMLVPADACLEDAPMRAIGAAAMMLDLMMVSIPLTLWVARRSASRTSILR